MDKINFLKFFTGRAIAPWLALTLIALTMMSGWSSGWLPFATTVHAQGNANVAISPSGLASLSYAPGTMVTFTIDVTNSQPYAGFVVGFFYNISILRLSTLDYSGNVFGNDTTLSSECINGIGNQCNFDNSFDGEGVVSLALYTTSGVNTPTPNGKLFSVTFTVSASGFSPLHVVRAALLTAPDGATLPSATFDSYFTNIDCAGVLCIPPTVSLIAPQNAVVGSLVTFDGSASKSQNLNGAIKQYLWVWRNGPNIALLSTTSPIATHTFGLIGQWTITLTVQDNYSISAIETLPFDVTRDQSKLSVSMFFTDSNLNYLPTREFGSLLYPTVETTVVHGVVRHTDPGFVLGWVNATNTGNTPLQSIRIKLQARPDWSVSPPWPSSTSAIHVYFANSSSLDENLEITQPKTISFSSIDNSISLIIPYLNLTGIGHPLMPGQGVLLSVKMRYALIGKTQSPSTYPRLYDFGSDALGSTQPGLSGSGAGGSLNLELLVVATSRGNDNNHSTMIV